MQDWRAGFAGRPQDWDDNKIPASYWTQGVWYGGALGLAWIDYAALIGGKGVLFRRLHIATEDFENLCKIGEQFWNDHVLARVEPPLDESDSTADTLKALYPAETKGKILEADADFMAAWEEFQALKAEAEAADARRKAARNKVVALIADAEAVVYGETPIATFRKSKDSIGIDKDRLKAERPDIYQEFERTSEGSRRLVPAK